MGKLEIDLYCIKNSILKVTSKETYFYYDELKTKKIYPIQEIELENYPYLQIFLEEDNHLMELKWNKKSKLFSASLLSFKENKKLGQRLLLREGYSFLSIFKALEEDLAMQQCRGFDSKLRKRLQWDGRFLISGTPKVNGVYIYEGPQLKCISETEFIMEDYLLSNGCDSLYQEISAGKMLEIRYEASQFLLELFSLVRRSRSGPFERKIEKELQGERLLPSLKKMNRNLEEEVTLSRRLKF